MRPRKFVTQSDAVRWARLGGIALYSGPEPALYASAEAAQKSEAMGWARWWAGKAGCTLVEIKNRGTFAEFCPLTEPQARYVAEQSLDGPEVIGSLPTTVVFFTGTRRGMSDEQRESLLEWLFNRNVLAGHHGCCIGADEEFHNIIYALRVKGQELPWCEHGNYVPWLTGWPAEVGPELSCVGRITLDDVRLKQAPLTRNRNMAAYAKWYATSGKPVDIACVACPYESEPPESGRGGTWHAIRQFRAAEIATTIITPTGAIRNEW